MSVMEKNLPIAESLGEGDMIRIVTSEGNSKQIDASEIGGGASSPLVVHIVEDMDEGGWYIYTSRYPYPGYNTIEQMLMENPNSVVVKNSSETSGSGQIYRFIRKGSYGELIFTYSEVRVGENYQRIGFLQTVKIDSNDSVSVDPATFNSIN